jgi:aminotransferase
MFSTEKYLSKRAMSLYGALGKQTSVPIPGLINLGSGTPDFSPPPFVYEAMQQALANDQIRYTSWRGIPELRAAIADKLLSENGVRYNPESEILVTSGAQEALMVTLMTLLDPGDEVITPSPHYDEYSRDAAILGGKLVPVATRPETNFTIDVADLEAAITERTRAIIVVTPNNPTGTVLSEQKLLEIADLAKRHDLLVVSDEIYEYYTYDGHRHISMASLPNMWERTITINSFSKSFAITGMRLGYIVAPEPIMEAMLPFHHAMMICANTVTQYGGLAIMTNPRDWFAPQLQEYDRRRHLWMESLNELALPYSQPQGAYYVFVDIRPTGLTSAAFVEYAREHAKLVFQPGTIGGGAGEGFIRAALTRSSPDLDAGLERFRTLIRGLT